MALTPTQILLNKKPKPKEPEPIHKPELEEGTMDIGKPKKKNGRPCKYDHAMPGWLRAKEYRMRKRAKKDG